MSCLRPPLSLCVIGNFDPGAALFRHHLHTKHLSSTIIVTVLKLANHIRFVGRVFDADNVHPANV